MSLMHDSTIFIIDSSKRVSGTTSNFTYLINVPKGHDYDRVCVLQAIIPKSFYLVNSPYNTFTLLENGVSTLITITEGNYNAQSWITIIAALLTTSSSQGWTYTISRPNAITQVDTGMFTYSVTGNSGNQPSIIFPTSSQLYEQFGFNYNSTNLFVSSSLTSSNIMKFQVEDVIFIHSNISANSDQSANNDVLQEIYASSTPNYSNIIYQNSGCIEAYSKKLLSPENNIFSFILTNESQLGINLRGLNCVITLIVYKKDNFNQLLAVNHLMNETNQMNQQNNPQINNNLS